MDLAVTDSLTNVSLYVTFAFESRPMIRTGCGRQAVSTGRVRCPRADLQPAPGRLRVFRPTGTSCGGFEVPPASRKRIEELQIQKPHDTLLLASVLFDSEVRMTACRNPVRTLESDTSDRSARSIAVLRLAS